MILNLSLIPTNGLPVIITKPGGGHPNASTLAVHPPSLHPTIKTAIQDSYTNLFIAEIERAHTQLRDSIMQR